MILDVWRQVKPYAHTHTHTQRATHHFLFAWWLTLLLYRNKWASFLGGIPPSHLLNSLWLRPNVPWDAASIGPAMNWFHVVCWLSTRHVATWNTSLARIIYDQSAEPCYKVNSLNLTPNDLPQTKLWINGSWVEYHCLVAGGYFFILSQRPMLAESLSKLSKLWVDVWSCDSFLWTCLIH